MLARRESGDRKKPESCVLCQSQTERDRTSWSHHKGASVDERHRFTLNLKVRNVFLDCLSNLLASTRTKARSLEEGGSSKTADCVLSVLAGVPEESYAEASATESDGFDEFESSIIGCEVAFRCR